MKKTALITVLCLVIAASFSCSKDKGDKNKLIAENENVKYARFTASVYKEQELKTWGSNISKTEPVALVETLKVQIKGAETEIAKVKLSDGTIAYIQLKYLADKPVVFVEDTKAYIRNNTSSKVYAVIPKGSIGFVVKEMSDWAQVYVGQIDGKWVTQHWVNGGYSSDVDKIQEAKSFEEAAAVLKKADAKPEQREQAIGTLRDIAESSGILSDAARSLIESETGEVSSESSGDSGDDQYLSSGSAKVSAPSGLTIREQPSASSTSIAVIPDGSVIKVISKNDSSETIAGKTSSWYEVEWNGNRGWVFGGFLTY